MKILFIQPYPTEGASARYRVEQYVPYLERNGIQCVIRPFVSAKFIRFYIKKDFISKKYYILFKAVFKGFLIYFLQ